MKKDYIIIFLALLFLIIILITKIPTYSNIEQLHKKLKIRHGNFTDELPEQQMIFKYIKAYSKILEFGPNIGRSSLIANSLLVDKSQHLCIETIPETCIKLKENRDLNNLEFQIFQGGISNNNLYQRGWRSSKIKKEGYTQVNTKPFSFIKNKYKINFNTIIADCEACIIPFLKENEYILNHINLIIIEHDFNNERELKTYYHFMNKYKFKLIDSIMKKKIGFKNWGVLTDPIFVSVWEKK